MFFFESDSRFLIDAAVVSLDYVTLANYIEDADGSSFGVLRFIRAARAFRLVRLLKMARFDVPLKKPGFSN